MTINRPEQRNAINMAVDEEIASAMGLPRAISTCPWGSSQAPVSGFPRAPNTGCGPFRAWLARVSGAKRL